MAMGTGMAGQVGWALEATPGLAVTPTTFVPFVGEKLVNSTPTILSAGIIAGRRLPTSAQHAQGNTTLKGSIDMELQNRGQEDLFTLLIGTPVKTGAGPFTRTYSPIDVSALSATMQVGRPEVGGTVDPFTWAGCKIPGAEIAFKAGEFVTFSADVVGMTEFGYRQVTDGVLNSTTLITSATANFVQADVGKPISATGIPLGATIAAVASATSATLSAAATATASGVTVTLGKALAAATFTAGQYPFTFAHHAASIASAGVNIKGGKLKFSTPVDDGRRFTGTRNIANPVENDVRDLSIELDCEWDTMNHYNRFLAHTEHAFSTSFTAGADSLTVTANVYYENSPKPTVNDRGILEQKLSLAASASGVDSTGYQVVLINSTP